MAVLHGPLAIDFEQLWKEGIFGLAWKYAGTDEK